MFELNFVEKKKKKTPQGSAAAGTRTRDTLEVPETQHVSNPIATAAFVLKISNLKICIRRLCDLSWHTLRKPKKAEGLSFQDLHSFNLAVLAKRGWRLLTRPESLVHKVLKACYFPNNVFWEAKLGFRPSATWRSILKGRECLQNGLRPLNTNEEMKVCELIDEGNRMWKEDVLHNLLWPVDVDRVLQVPLASAPSEDTLTWWFSKHGQFSVRSCYFAHMETGSDEIDRVESSGTMESGWNFIWRMRTPNKIQCFLWHIAWNIVPAHVNLCRRKIVSHTNCLMCDHDEEDMRLALYECRAAAEVWNLSGLVNGVAFNEA
ncbi:hypothetical protein CDL12_13981 [Handroanthus impetiginosus]|uniref:Reverse transcriptase zinc-binding domain-containing protein n=1 Tax=Handroanthus impetiginosus TaxID=429701 RepID=A0A2G9H7A5_9LAMI|nr:hypothetical protein CDL12_13981 [Handroanthus impetiginosus]